MHRNARPNLNRKRANSFVLTDKGLRSFESIFTILIAREKTVISAVSGTIKCSCEQHELVWRVDEPPVISRLLLLLQASGSQTVFSFSPLIFFFFGGGGGRVRVVRIQRLCLDAFSTPGLQSNFLTELCSVRHLHLEMEICNWE